MTHPDAESLIRSYRLTYHLIRLQTEGLTHADSLLQPPFRGNCLNWVLGHIVAGRSQAHALLTGSPLWPRDEAARYETGSQPITTTEQALSLDRLLADLERSQQAITAAVERLSREDLAATVVFRGDQQPLGQALAGLHWHETYHTGQLELLRQLAGKNDAVV